jgi:metallo-beta-lactamase family protein
LRLRFLGAAGQVTGSCFLLETGDLRLLVDCGAFQERAALDRNWEPFPVPPETLDAVLLTHAHVDHSGLLPKLVKEDFGGRIVTTAATADLLSIVLMDSARIQEEDAAFKKKRHLKEGRTGPHPEVPLYTVEDAERTLPLVEDVAYDAPIPLGEGIVARFHDAGHILGSAMIELTVPENGAVRTVLFSGDIGQWNKPLVRDPSVFARADTVVMESTYGDREHEDPKDVETLLADAVNAAVRAGGNVVIPTFAVERAQELMFHFGRLLRAKRIPPLLFFLDSPMAVDVTEVFEAHPECLDEETIRMIREDGGPFSFPGLKLIRTTEESKAINAVLGTSVIMAGSGMCTAGRIKHHLARNIGRPESVILFVGYQARDTLGRRILERPPDVRIFGETRPVRARIEKIEGFSAHADRRGLHRWLDAFQTPPRRLFVCHGDGDVSEAFAAEIRKARGWRAIVPSYGQEFFLDEGRSS